MDSNGIEEKIVTIDYYNVKKETNYDSLRITKKENYGEEDIRFWNWPDDN